MWFGDLVTMEWWDDLWLNESFADWMGDKITDQVYPEFGHADRRAAGHPAGDEHRRARRPPTRSARRTRIPNEAMRNVGIAYNKGKAVLSMFEQWIGPEKFRQGVLDHLKSNAWGNANAVGVLRLARASTRRPARSPRWRRSSTSRAFRS